MSKSNSSASRPAESRVRSRGAKRGSEKGADRFRLSAVAADRDAQQKQQLASLGAFLGYMLAVWLIVQSANNPPSEPAFGYRWSPAILGLVVVVATALLRNERNIRAHSRVFDPDRVSRLTYSVAWSVLALIAMAAVMTIPRY